VCGLAQVLLASGRVDRNIEGLNVEAAGVENLEGRASWSTCTCGTSVPGV
jgi:hypothetical protein